MYFNGIQLGRQGLTNPLYSFLCSLYLALVWREGKRKWLSPFPFSFSLSIIPFLLFSSSTIFIIFIIILNLPLLLFPLLLISMLDQIYSILPSFPLSRTRCQLFIIIFLINLARVYNFLHGRVVSLPSWGAFAVQLISQNLSAYLGAQPPHASKVVCVFLSCSHIHIQCMFSFTLFTTLLLCNQNKHHSPSQHLLCVPLLRCENVCVGLQLWKYEHKILLVVVFVAAGC